MNHGIMNLILVGLNPLSIWVAVAGPKLLYVYFVGNLWRGVIGDLGAGVLAFTSFGVDFYIDVVCALFDAGKW